VTSVASKPSPSAGPARPASGELEPLLARRILVLDGAMGTMIQSYHLGEQDYRGEPLRRLDSRSQG